MVLTPVRHGGSLARHGGLAAISCGCGTGVRFPPSGNDGSSAGMTRAAREWRIRGDCDSHGDNVPLGLLLVIQEFPARITLLDKDVLFCPAHVFNSFLCNNRFNC